MSERRFTCLLLHHMQREKSYSLKDERKLLSFYITVHVCALSLFKERKTRCTSQHIHFFFFKLTCFILASSRLVCSSFRRSFLLPTRIMGTFGQKCFTSGVHFSGIFSTAKREKECSNQTHTSVTRRLIHRGVTVAQTIPKLSGLSTEKHMRITSVSG